jgi:hypothetical protein
MTAFFTASESELISRDGQQFFCYPTLYVTTRKHKPNLESLSKTSLGQCNSTELVID